MGATTARAERVRPALFWLHLVAGVTAGLAIGVMSLTGALLALQPQVLDWLERDQRRVHITAAWPRLAPSALLAAAVGQRPLPETVTLTLSHDAEEAALIALGRGEVRYVHPYTGAVLGQGAARARRAFLWLTEFHRWFAAPAEWRATARSVTGWSTVAFVVLAVSGVVLWLPRRISADTLARAATLAWPATPRARDFNWHTVLGLWTAPILLVLAVSGVILAFPWANRLLQRVAGTPVTQAAQRPDAAAGRQPRAEVPALDPARIDAAWKTAEQQLPTWGTIVARIPARTKAPVSFTITDTTHWNRYARSQLTVDDRGGVVRWEPYSSITRGQRWRGWARFAHTGELGGLPGQLLAGGASAAAVVLVWTGLALALRRLARTREAKREVSRAA